MERVLYVASSWPVDGGFGGQLRALHIGRALKSIGAVTLLVVGSEATNEESMRQSLREFEALSPVSPVISSDRGLRHKLRRVLDTHYLNVHGCQAMVEDQCRVESLLPHFDLVWLLNSRTPNILNRFSWLRTHLDIDDLPSTYLAAVARTGPRGSGRWKARIQGHLMKRRELVFKRRFTTLSVCSEEDRRYLGGGNQIHVIPNGFVRPASLPQRQPSTVPPRLGFIGLYSYAPNQEGVRWFLKKVWPSVREAVPGVRFRLVGKDSDGQLRPPDPDVDALGWVENPAAEIATWSGMVIPIQFGGGTRIKVADAFSRKCPVVSTRFGALGYEVENTRELLLADEPDQFARACVSLIRDPMKASSMAETAYQRFLDHWTWEAIAPRVWAAAEDCLRRSKNAPQAKPA